MKRFVCWTLLMFGTYAWGSVAGKRAEIFGAGGSSSSFAQWLNDNHALITPAIANLAAQSCLRDAQQITDASAYQEAHDLVAAMSTHFASAQGAPASLAELAAVAHALDAINLPLSSTPEQYTQNCTTLLKARFAADHDTLYPLFAGRMAPKANPELVARGLAVVPLTWSSLASNTCELEGAAATSRNPELWKFFSLNRLLGSVLPQDDQSSAFQAAVDVAPEVTALLAQLDRYNSIAGKSNGAAVAFSSERGGNPRMTGPAAGSRASSLLAFFTTGWREKLQMLTMSRPYPTQAFALLSSGEILSALEATDVDLRGTEIHGASPTELGMSLAWNLMAPQRTVTDEYDPSPTSFRAQANLAWLALNAETNLRQNEKLPGVRHSIPSTGVVSVWGAPGAYEVVERSLESARTRLLEVVSEDHLPGCLDEMSAVLSAAGTIPSGQVETLSQALSMQLAKRSFSPVYADIGLEVEDPQDGDFRLGLATGGGHLTQIQVNGKSYELWSPSAMVLHRAKLLNTGQWKQGLVQSFDPGA